MKTAIRTSSLCGVLLTAALCPVAGAEEKAPPANIPAQREESVLVTITASVQAIDHAKRDVTLKGPLGNVVSFVVDERVKRLHEVKVGDVVVADYYVSVAAELRKPTPEEEREPFVLLDAKGESPKGTAPAAGGLRRFKVVTTIEGLDRPTETITVKGPMGNLFTTRVADPSNLPKLRIGETIVITYTEALAISLEKAGKTGVK